MVSKGTRSVTPDLTLKEVAAELKVHINTAYDLIHNRGLPAFKVGRDWRVQRVKFDRWKQTNQSPPKPKQ